MNRIEQSKEALRLFFMPVGNNIDLVPELVRAAENAKLTQDRMEADEAFSFLKRGDNFINPATASWQNELSEITEFICTNQEIILSIIEEGITEDSSAAWLYPQLAIKIRRILELSHIWRVINIDWHYAAIQLIAFLGHCLPARPQTRTPATA